MYQLFGASGYYSTSPMKKQMVNTYPQINLKNRANNITNLQHLPIMRIQILILRHLPLAIIPPKPPIKFPPHPLQLARPRPHPRRPQIISIPEEQVGECGCETEVGGEELDDPGSGVEGETLFGEEGWVDFVVGVED